MLDLLTYIIFGTDNSSIILAGGAVGVVISAVVSVFSGVSITTIFKTLAARVVNLLIGTVLKSLAGKPKRPVRPSRGTSTTRNPHIESPTYGFEGLRNTFTQDQAVPVVLGGPVRVGGQVFYQELVAANDENSVLEMCVGLSMGEIEDITDIRFNGIPFSEFTGTVTTTKHFGTNPQAAEERIKDPFTTVDDNTIVEEGSSVLLTTTTSNAENLVIGLQAPEGLFDASGEDVTSETINYRIEFKEAADVGFTLVGDFTKTAKSRQTLRWEKVVKFGLTPGKYTIRITNNTPGRDEFQFIDTLAIDYFRFGVSANLSYPDLAYLALTIEANRQISGAPPNITCQVTGVKVRDVDDITLPKAFSNNPANILHEVLTNNLWGMAYRDDQINIDSFKEVKAYSNELVDGEKRFQIDYALDAFQSRIDLLQHLLQTFRGFLVWSNGKWKLRVEKDEVPVAAFTLDNILLDSNGKSSFKFSKRSFKDRANRIRVQFTDKDNSFNRSYYTVEDSEELDELGLSHSEIIEDEIDLFGITRRKQAQLMGTYHYKLNKFADTYVQFKTHITALNVEPGDVITITHDVPGFTAAKFRISEIREDQRDEFLITAVEHIPSLYDDTEAFVTSVFASEQDPLSSLPNPTDMSGAAVTDVGLDEELIRQNSGDLITKLNVSWNKPEAPDDINYHHAKIYLSEDSGITFVHQQDSFTTSTDLLFTDQGLPKTILVKVVTANSTGFTNFDTAPTATTTVLGKTAPPDDVIGFAGAQSADKANVILSWDPNTDLDLFGYELRFGALNADGGSWENSILVDTDIQNTTVNYPAPADGTYAYRIKAIDTTGNFSLLNTITEITIKDRPDIDIFFRDEPTIPWDGILGNAIIDAPRLASGLTAFDVLTLRPPTLIKWDQIGKKWDNGTQWDEADATSTETGTYITPIIDLTEKVEVQILTRVSHIVATNLKWDNGTKWDATGLHWDEGVAAEVTQEISLSDDGVTFTAFEPLTAQEYSTKFFKIKLTLFTPDDTKNLEVYEFTITVLKKQLLETRTTAVPSSEIVVSFTVPFFSPPVIVASAITSSINKSVILSSVTKSDFKVKIFDKIDGLVAGDVNWIARGS